MTRRLSRSNTVLALIAVMAGASILVGGAVTTMLAAERDKLDATAQRVNVVHELSNELTAAGSAQELALGDYIMSRQLPPQQRFDAAVLTYSQVADALRAATVDFPELRAAVDERIAARQTWRERVAGPVIIAVGSGDAPAITRFAEGAASDRVPMATAAAALDAALGRVTADLAAREASAASAGAIGIIIAFAFLVLAFGVAMASVRRFGRALELDARQASVLNRFTEVTSFADDDQEVATANLVALGRLVRPDASVMHILNRSLDRAIPEASSGDAIAEVLPLHALDRCAGVLRGTTYVTDDLADELSVHCPIYPVRQGTLACVPLMSGDSVGTVHLYWNRPNALPLPRRAAIARVTEHAALAIGNRRMLAALHGQANTDARTGLANSRSFDLALDAALAARSGDETVGVLMLDIDHFKAFNDRHGHPAGDEALKAFAGVLRSCMRDGDVAARYGGEEFVVLLRGQGGDVASAVAERIRARTESTILSLAPGLTDRITVSIGIAVAPDQGLDRVTLLRLADEALYRAKEGGRNRIAA
ncbi:MAG: GGDEF domain-containing protein [Candidatus Limnocylindrales bacterium]